jgi:hypothetical protein
MTNAIKVATTIPIAIVTETESFLQNRAFCQPLEQHSLLKLLKNLGYPAIRGGTELVTSQSEAA